MKIEPMNRGAAAELGQSKDDADADLKRRQAAAQAQVEAIEQQMEAMESTRKCNILPDSRFMRYWDLYMMALLVYTAIVTPFEVAFLETSMNYLFWFNNFVDVSFFSDMFVQINLSYYDEETAQMVHEKKRIVGRYVKSWFIIDFVSVLPFNSIGLFSKNDAFSELKIFRIVRLARLIKLVRVLKSSAILARYEASIGLSFSTMSLVKFFVMVNTIAHWSACVWRMAGTLGEGYDSWLTAYGIQDARAGDQYIAAFYWAVMTLTTIGYGDITPQNTLERVVATLTMLVGGAVYAYVVGAVCGIVSSMNQELTDFHQTMDHLNSYLSEVKAPDKMRVRLRQYFTQCKALHKHKYNLAVLMQMSPGLRREFAAFCHGEWIRSVHFFTGGPPDMEQDFISAIALKLSNKAFPAFELLIRLGEVTDQMYIIRRGLCGKGGRVCTSGRYVGEDMILKDARRNYTVTCLTFVDVMALTRDDLEDVLRRGGFDEQKRIIRKAACWLRLRFAFNSLATEIRAVKLLTGKLPTFEDDAARLKFVSNLRSFKGMGKNLLWGAAEEEEMVVVEPKVQEAIERVLRQWMFTQGNVVRESVRDGVTKTEKGLRHDIELLVETKLAETRANIVNATKARISFVGVVSTCVVVVVTAITALVTRG